MPKGSLYCLEYNKGNIVKAIPGSFGIMVFKSYKSALAFAGPDDEILKVRAIGRKRNFEVLGPFNKNNAGQNTKGLKEFYKIHNLKKHLKHWYYRFLTPSGYLTPPLGTECYPAVEVLE
jgi:hypothetical protein